MNQLQRIFVWLSRMSKSRGFGVQSPSAYRFIRYVVSEHYPYYAYAELRRLFPTLSWLQRKRMELYFRVSNFRQACVMYDYSKDNSVFCCYVVKGCRRTEVRNLYNTSQDGNAYSFRNEEGGNIELVRICPIEGCVPIFESLLSHVSSGTVLMIEDIYSNSLARSMWKRLVESQKVSVSYDLYYLGIAFFDTKRHKSNYKVNF